MEEIEIKIISKFTHKPDITTQCRLNSIADILQYNGIKLSEEMCFGLGEALTFEYWLDTSSKFPTIIINGFDFNMENRLFNKFNVRRITHYNSKLDNKDIINCINKNDLVMVDLDRYYLDYLDITKAHFGFHSVIIIGYKIENKILYWGIIDGLKKELIWYPDKKLRIARDSTCGILKSNKWYEFHCQNVTNKRIENLEYSIIKDSINNLSKKMLFSESLGINALMKFSNEIGKCINYDKNIKDIMKIEFFFIHKCIKEFEYTGTLSRRIYAKFLKECTELYGDEFLRNAFIQMDGIADEWEKLSEVSITESDIENKALLVSAQIIKIYEMEKQVYEYLKANTK